MCDGELRVWVPQYQGGRTFTDVVSMGFEFGPAIPSPESCAQADRAPEAFAAFDELLRIHEHYFHGPNDEYALAMQQAIGDARALLASQPAAETPDVLWVAAAGVWTCKLCHGVHPHHKHDCATFAPPASRATTALAPQMLTKIHDGSVVCCECGANFEPSEFEWTIHANGWTHDCGWKTRQRPAAPASATTALVCDLCGSVRNGEPGEQCGTRRTSASTGLFCRGKLVAAPAASDAEAGTGTSSAWALARADALCAQLSESLAPWNDEGDRSPTWREIIAREFDSLAPPAARDEVGAAWTEDELLDAYAETLKRECAARSVNSFEEGAQWVLSRLRAQRAE